jgi:hypothetical protein
VVRVHGAAETGLTVLLSEITGAIGRAGGATVWTSWEPRPWQHRELEVLAARGGIDDLVDIVTTGDGREQVLERGLARCAELARDHAIVAHVVFEQEGRLSSVEAAFPHLREAATVTFVVRPWEAVTRGDVPLRDGPHDALIRTDERLAAQWIYPAIDPQRSSSRFTHPRAQVAIAERARELVATYAALDPGLTETGSDDPADQRTIDRARRLLAYLTQPFACAEPDTGWPAAAVPGSQTLRDVARILSGELDSQPEDELRYLGAIDD